MSQTRQAARATTGRDLYKEVTDKLIAAIERDPGRPQMPWRRAGAPLWMPVNAQTENQYRGINVVTLWCVAEEKGYTHPIFATYKQWQELGAQVRKGEKSALVIKYGEYEVEPDADREDDDGKRVYPPEMCQLVRDAAASMGQSPSAMLLRIFEEKLRASRHARSESGATSQ